MNSSMYYFLHCVRPVCTARAWLLMAGFSLAFGAMFSKTWRVHSIFTDVKLNKKVIKDYQLFMVVGILLAIDVIIMLTWQFADPFYRSTKQIEPMVRLSLRGCPFARKLSIYLISRSSTAPPVFGRCFDCARERVLRVRTNHHIHWCHLCIQRITISI